MRAEAIAGAGLLALLSTAHADSLGGGSLKAGTSAATAGGTSAVAQAVLSSGATMSGPLSATVNLSGIGYAYGAQIISNVVGGSMNGPRSAQVGAMFKCLKKNWNARSALTGECDGLYVVTRQGGPADNAKNTSDTSGLLIDTQGTGAGFINGIEMAVNLLPIGAAAITDGLDFQIGDVGGGSLYGASAFLNYKSKTTATAYSANSMSETGTTERAVWDVFLSMSNGGLQEYVLKGDGTSNQAGLATMASGIRGKGTAPSSNFGGWQLGWNASGGGGETDFWNTLGGGGTGGFRWYDTSNSSIKAIATLSKNGTITATNMGVSIVGGKVYLDPTQTMWVQETSAGRVVIGTGTTNLFSVDSSGNVIARGTITSHAVP